MRSEGSAGSVVGLYVAEMGGAPMRPVRSAAALAGQGFVGDRYETGLGEWSYDAALCNDVTLIAVEVLAAVLADGGPDLRGGGHRRNVETVGVELDTLVGKRFRLGGVELYGDRPCHPCPYLDRVTGVRARSALTGRGGLRATVLVGGEMAVGDALR